MRPDLADELQEVEAHWLERWAMRLARVLSWCLPLIAAWIGYLVGAAESDFWLRTAELCFERAK